MKIWVGMLISFFGVEIWPYVIGGLLNVEFILGVCESQCNFLWVGGH